MPSRTVRNVDDQDRARKGFARSTSAERVGFMDSAYSGMTQPSRPPTVTIEDVAQAAGVHASTVSRALNPLERYRVREPTRAKILDAVDRLGYRPDLVARGLKRGRTGTVGIVVADLGNAFATSIIHGLTTAVAGAGMLPLVAESNNEPSKLEMVLEHFLSRRADAVVVAAASRGDKDLLEQVGSNVPIVVALRPVEGSDLPHVVHDDLDGGRQVAEHLRSLGHQTAVQLPGPVNVVNFDRRRRGFSDDWAKASLEEIDPPLPSLSGIADGERMLEEVLARNGDLPTAIFANSDFMAMGALAVLRRRGLSVPTSVSLVGFNDLPTSEHLVPALTTVKTKTFEIGYVAGSLVTDLLNGETVSSITLATTLIERASTAFPAQA